MASRKQTTAAKRNSKRAAAAAKLQRSNANLPPSTRRARGRRGAGVSRRNRSGAEGPKTRAEVYEEAKRRNLPRRSKIGRYELARVVGQG